MWHQHGKQGISLTVSACPSAVCVCDHNEGVLAGTQVGVRIVWVSEAGVEVWLRAVHSQGGGPAGVTKT